MIDLSIIIVNYNVKEFLQNLLHSIDQASKHHNVEVIVADNASDDGSVDILRNKYPDVKLIANKDNVGFGKANNQGLEISSGRYLLLINPDTIVKEDTFEHLINFMNKSPEVGMVGCKVLNPDGTLQLACRRSFPGPWTSFTKITGLSSFFPKSKLFGRYNMTYLNENESYEVDAISGCFMFLRREVYEATKGFDPQFFMYGEDLDLCFRTQKAGYKVYYYHQTEIIHYKGESTKRSSIDETKIFYEAMQIFVKKHLSASFIVSGILQLGIIIRKLLAFLNKNKLVLIGLFFDFILFNLVFYFSEKSYRTGSWEGIPEEVKPWIFLVPSTLQVLISASVGAYKKNSISVLRSLASLFVGLIVLSALTFFFKQYAYSRAVLLIMYSALLVVFPVWRILFKVIFKSGLEAGSENAKTIIVGTGEHAQELGVKLAASFTNLHNVIGLIGNSVGEIGSKVGNFEVIGSLDTIRKVIRENNVDKVIFTSAEVKFYNMFSIVSICEDEKVEFLVAGNELDYMVGKSSVSLLDDISLLKIQYNISQPIHKFIKLTVEKFISIPIFFLLFPFVFIFDKISKNKSEWRNFILGIPQVLVGKKSIVGPYLDGNPNGLYLGKAGLTGLWYTEPVDLSDNEEINKLNLFYAKNQNIWLDLEIIGKAIAKMFTKRRRYEQ